MYAGLSNEICHMAWAITKASTLEAARHHVTNKAAGTIVVCSPRTIVNDDFDVLYRSDVDSDHPNRNKYEEIAIAKAKVSWNTGLSSRKVQQDAPHLYQPGMTKWGGSVIENGLIVAFSGVQAVFDEAIAGTMLRWIVTLCQHEMTREGGMMDSDASFIGELPPAMTDY